MNTYIFLQHYWWFVVSLLGALLVFLLFVQGGNSLLFCLGKTEEQKKMMINSTGRKWEFTFTTLVTFGGAFFASFPLFYSTSFGGAYWLWMIIIGKMRLRGRTFLLLAIRRYTFPVRKLRFLIIIRNELPYYVVGKERVALSCVGLMHMHCNQ